MARQFKYRLWCVTEGAWKYVWADEADAVPTECPTTPADTMDAAKTVIAHCKDEEIYSNTSFPSPPEAKKFHWKTDEAKLYRRTDEDDAWEEVGGINNVDGGVPNTNYGASLAIDGGSP